MLGFVVNYPVPVPWNLTTDEAEDLIQSVSPFVSTCMVTGGSTETVVDLANIVQPNVVQLHYQESLAEINEITWELNRKGIKIVKALRIDQNGKCNFEITDPILAAKELSKTGISAILVDSYTESRTGGTGVMVNTSTFKMIQQGSTVPVILAGGLNPNNIYSLIKDLQPYAVDVLTGVEEKPGKKDEVRTRQFIKSVRMAKLSGK
jgi:phosphoribosylanthranilate isomerase